MKYMDQVRSLSTKRGVGVEAMDAMGEPLMEYMHQVRSLSTKRGGPVRAMGAIGNPEMSQPLVPCSQVGDRSWTEFLHFFSFFLRHRRPMATCMTIA